MIVQGKPLTIKNLQEETGMKRNIGKITIVLAVLLIMTLALNACTGNQTDSSSKTSQVESNATPTPEELKPVDLIWYTIGTQQTDQEAVNEAMSAITQEEINATISINTIGWGEYNDRMNMLMSSGEEFDLCFTSSWANDYHSSVKRGAYVELDELLETYGQDIFDQVPEKYFEAARYDGKIYAMINYQILASSPGLMVKKDLAEKYDFDPSTVKKIADMEGFFQQVKDNEEGITPLLTQGGDIPPFNFETGFIYDKATSSWGLPVYVKLDEMKALYLGRTDERKALDSLMRSWYDKGFIRRDAASITDFVAEQKSGKYAAYVIGTLKPGGEVEAAKQNGYEVISVPIAPSYINTTSILATLTAVSRTSKNPERAVMFYNLIHKNKDLYNLACVGVEGTHYNKAEGEYIEPIENSGYAPSTDWLFGNQFNAYLRPGMDADVWEKTVAFNEAAVASPLLGFIYNSENTKTEIANIEAIIAEYAPAIATGTIDPEEYYDEIFKRVDDAGMQKVLDDIQAQLDAWK